ncbi:hypothetical protein DM992_20170 [Burkholderia sp. JP2-270]|nr:hypothetical protein DM992_20170 [Burkholderia sp. JP2-270]
MRVPDSRSVFKMSSTIENLLRVLAQIAVVLAALTVGTRPYMQAEFHGREACDVAHDPVVDAGVDRVAVRCCR